MNEKIFQLLLIVIFAAMIGACQTSQTSPTATASTGDTPTEGFKRLFAAVKSKDTEAVKKTMSKTTNEFAQGMAEMQKQSVAEVYKNGLIESTMSPNLPPMRDERIKGNFGAIEVQTPKGTWEDVSFVLEDNQWKLAVGDLFKGSFVSPGKPKSQANANTQVPQMMPAPNTAGNSNSVVPPGNSSVNPELKPSKGSGVGSGNTNANQK